MYLTKYSSSIFLVLLIFSQCVLCAQANEKFVLKQYEFLYQEFFFSGDVNGAEMFVENLSDRRLKEIYKGVILWEVGDVQGLCEAEFSDEFHEFFLRLCHKLKGGFHEDFKGLDEDSIFYKDGLRQSLYGLTYDEAVSSSSFRNLPEHLKVNVIFESYDMSLVYKYCSNLNLDSMECEIAKYIEEGTASFDSLPYRSRVEALFYLFSEYSLDFSVASNVVGLKYCNYRYYECNALKASIGIALGDTEVFEEGLSAMKDMTYLNDDEYWLRLKMAISICDYEMYSEYLGLLDSSQVLKEGLSFSDSCSG